MSINATEAIKVVLEQHWLWFVSGGYQGTRADLQGADLQGANLQGADLEGANLKGALLHDANLENANLQGADLHGTILEKKQEKVSEEIGSVSSPSNLRAKFDEFAKSLGLEIVSLKVKRSETFDL